jgi:nucleoid DNA-binding protein
MKKNSIIKSDLIDRLSKKLPELPLRDVKLAVDIMLDQIT